MLDPMNTQDSHGKRRQDGPAWLAAKAHGFDMHLLEESLSLTPHERLRLMSVAVNRLERLEAAMQGARRAARSSD